MMIRFGQVTSYLVGLGAALAIVIEGELALGIVLGSLVNLMSYILEEVRAK